MDKNDVNQRGASAGGNLVGRDDNSVRIMLSPDGQIGLLVKQLDREIHADELREQWIDELQFFEEPYAPDGVKGLEAKLTKCGRPDKIQMALRQKELFVKFLSKWSLYGAAQQLLALCLHRIQAEFDTHVHPHCGSVDGLEIDQIVAEKVVKAVVVEYGFGTFALNHGLVMGMTYWLADRCYVRWHAA